MANALETRTNNVINVLRQIQLYPGISKPQLCKRCDITASTVQNIVEKLVDKGAVLSFGQMDSTGGRRARQYKMNPDFKLVVSVSIRLNCADIAIANMGLTILHHTHIAIGLDSTGPESYTAMLVEAIRKLIRDNAINLSDLSGVGVTVPGPTYFESGTVRQIAGAALWQDFPLGARISAALSLPVWVDKDAFAGLQYLAFTNQIALEKTTVYITILEGISAAVMMNSEVFRGSNSLAGEIGHITVRRDGSRCHCGNIGCLELYCSDLGIISQYSMQSENKGCNIDDIIRLAERGDQTAQQVFVQAVRYLVDTTCNVIMNYDPDEIVIFCRWLHRQQTLYFSLMDSLYSKSIFTQRHAVNLRLLEPQNIYLLSAAAAACWQFLFSKSSPFITTFDH